MKQIIFLISLLLISLSSLQAADPEAHWSYQGDDGPEHWGELSEKYKMCREGRNQSPVNLVAVFYGGRPGHVLE
jgi:carbonic anhydrase